MFYLLMQIESQGGLDFPEPFNIPGEYTYIYIYIYIYKYVIHIYIYIYKYTNLSTHTYIHKYIEFCIYMYT
jgi:hypothetical protein